MTLNIDKPCQRYNKWLRHNMIKKNNNYMSYSETHTVPSIALKTVKSL